MAAVWAIIFYYSDKGIENFFQICHKNILFSHIFIPLSQHNLQHYQRENEVLCIHTIKQQLYTSQEATLKKQSEIVWHLKSQHGSVLKLKTNATPSLLFHLYQFSTQSALSHDTLHVWAWQWMPLQLISEHFVTPWKPIRGLLTHKLHYAFSSLHIYCKKQLIQHFSYK